MLDGKIQAFQAWLVDTVLPMWTHRGVSPRSGLPFEALDADGAPLQADFHRILSIARQAFFLLRMQQRRQAGCAERALDYVDRLHHAFRDPATGTFPFTVDAHGMPLDGRRDLYTHAFVVFAYAEAYRHTGDAIHRDRANHLLQAVRRHFLRPGAVAYASSLSADLAAELVGPQQNPHMHLFEAIAWLALASGEEEAKAGLNAVAAMTLRVFGHAGIPAVLELPVGAAGNRIEPGHQAEWFSLACIAKPLLGSSELPAFAQRAFSAARQQMLAADFTLALSVTPDLRPLDGTRRVWTQLELVRALAFLRNEGAASPELEPALDALVAQFVRPHGWLEAVDGQGTVIRADMPATTPYHLVTCLDALTPV